MFNPNMPDYIFALPKSTAEINPAGEWDDKPFQFSSQAMYIRIDLVYGDTTATQLHDGTYIWCNINGSPDDDLRLGRYFDNNQGQGIMIDGNVYAVSEVNVHSKIARPRPKSKN